MKFALQLYSVRTDLESDFKGTLRKVKEMGYDGVEFAGLYGQDPKEIREYLVSLGLEPAGAHVSLAEMRADIGKVISDYSAVGCRDITVPYLMPEDRPGTPGWERTVADIRDIGEKVFLFLAKLVDFRKQFSLVHAVRYFVYDDRLFVAFFFDVKPRTDKNFTLARFVRLFYFAV